MNQVQAKRLLKLADFLEKEVHGKKGKLGQKKFDMGHFFRRPQDCPATTVGFKEVQCGTSACALGWATVVFPRQLQIERIEAAWTGDPVDYAGVGLKGADLEDFEAAQVFFGLDAGDVDEDGPYSDKEVQHIFGGEHKRTAKQEATVIRAFVAKKLRQQERETKRG